MTLWSLNPRNVSDTITMSFRGATNFARMLVYHENWHRFSSNILNFGGYSKSSSSFTWCINFIFLPFPKIPRVYITTSVGLQAWGWFAGCRICWCLNFFLQIQVHKVLQVLCMVGTSVLLFSFVSTLFFLIGDFRVASNILLDFFLSGESHLEADKRKLFRTERIILRIMLPHIYTGQYFHFIF